MIYGIGDLHFDHSNEKPMDIFGDNWIKHDDNIVKNWLELVNEDDLILLPGDISWGLRIEDAYEDLRRIDELPGTKIMVKGNHDYWWQSLNKLNNLGLESIFFIQNNSFLYKDICIAGTRGWQSPDSDTFSENDKKIYLRELNRLRLSLSHSNNQGQKKIVMIHYPPFNIDLEPNEFVNVMKEFQVDICIYGHLHAEGHRFAVEGNIDGIEFHCVSSDYINFKPKLILGE